MNQFIKRGPGHFLVHSIYTYIKQIGIPFTSQNCIYTYIKQISIPSTSHVPHVNLISVCLRYYLLLVSLITNSVLESTHELYQWNLLIKCSLLNIAHTPMTATLKMLISWYVTVVYQHGGTITQSPMTRSQLQRPFITYSPAVS